MRSAGVQEYGAGRLITFGRYRMLRWALVFFVLAVVAAVLGFGGIAAGLASIAKILFVLFLVLFIVAALMGALRGRTPI
jgi:uncharacterized membrane protein YtjA (UPF0391 family)